MTQKETSAAEKIIVALDCSPDEARKLAHTLAGHAHWLKVGMTLYYQAGASLVREFQEMGFNIFLDLKLCDIPHQVRGAAKAAMESGADILSVHALGGPEMLRAACEGAREANETGQVIAITVLTSIDKETMNGLGIPGEVKPEAERLAAIAVDAGCAGVVCSGNEAASLREELGADPLIVTPGIRLAEGEPQDQARVMTPGKAIEAGASMLVIGRPITAAKDPAAAFDACVTNIEG